MIPLSIDNKITASAYDFRNMTLAVFTIGARENEVTVDYVSKRATLCERCGSLFQKGDLRMTVRGMYPMYQPYGNYGSRPRLYCANCVMSTTDRRFVDENGNLVNRPEQYWCNLKKADKFPVQMFIKRQAKINATLKLSKHIIRMNIKELKEELNTRKLALHGRKSELQDRLREYLSKRYCRKYQRKQDKTFVDGFCREFEKKNEMNIPIVLRAIVQKYFPVVIL